MVLQFLRKHSSAIFALLGVMIYIGCRESGLDKLLAAGISFIAVVSIAMLLRRRPADTTLD